MDLLLVNRPPAGAACDRWRRAHVTSLSSGPVNATIDHYETDVRVLPGQSAADTFFQVRDRLFAYDFFPPWLIRHAICLPGRISAGAVIVQRILLGPVAVEAAVKVVDAWDLQESGSREAGFSYVTLEGHPECGVATFRVRLDEAGRVTVLLDARSRPGTLLTRLGRPIARTFQRAITRAGLRRLSRC